MGLWKKLTAEEMILKRRRAKNKPKAGKLVAVEVTGDSARIQKMMTQIPRQVRLATVKKSVRKVAQKNRRDLKKALMKHRSAQTGTAAKQSKKVKQARAYRDKSLQQSPHYRVKTYGPRVVAFIGPSRPDGNHAHFLENGVTRQLWGGKVYRQPPRPIIRDTMQKTQRAQVALLLRTMRQHAFDDQEDKG